MYKKNELFFFFFLVVTRLQYIRNQCSKVKWNKKKKKIENTRKRNENDVCQFSFYRIGRIVNRTHTFHTMESFGLCCLLSWRRCKRKHFHHLRLKEFKKKNCNEKR